MTNWQIGENRFDPGYEKMFDNPGLVKLLNFSTSRCFNSVRIEKLKSLLEL